MQDSFHRKHTYLRLAITDRCNLRCRYCMPAEGIDFSPREELLTYEEMLRLTGLFRTEGLNKVRLTGGEPLARKGVDGLIAQLNGQGLQVHLTTNGVLLGEFMATLKSNHLAGLNISLDSLQPEKFFSITRRDNFADVWRNLEMVVQLGIPTKLNVVVMAGMNDDEIIPFVKLAKTMPIGVRFIEAMPFNAGDGNRTTYLSAAAIEEKIRAIYPDLTPAIDDPHAAADRYQLPGWAGSIGIIPAYTRSLCGRCNRLRLTPKGRLLNCLYTQDGLELLPLLRQGIADDELLELVQAYLNTKAINGHEAERLAGRASAYASMTTIGG